MPNAFDALPSDLAAAHAALVEERAARLAAEAERDQSRSTASQADALVAYLKLEIEKLRRALYGARSESKQRLLEQLELQLEETRAAATEDELAAERSAQTSSVKTFERKRPARKPLSAHLPRERVVAPAPSSCPCCGSNKLSKLGEDVTETLEVIPRQWKVIQTVRERFSCRACETITQPPAPFHAIPRGLAGPSLLAMILFEKFGQHQPLNHQSERYDDTPIPVQSPGRGRTKSGRLWVVVRDEGTWASLSPPAAFYRYSPDRKGEHAQALLASVSGFLHADAYAGFDKLYEPDLKTGRARLLPVACWAHARCELFDEYARTHSPIALQALEKIGALFGVEREINGQDAESRRAVRRARSVPLLVELKAHLETSLNRISGKSDLAKAIRYSLNRWEALCRFTEDGRLEMSNNAAERAIRPLTLGRRNWTFLGSDSGGERAAIFFTLIQSCKLNSVNPEAYLADLIGRVGVHPANRIDELLPWNWSARVA